MSAFLTNWLASVPAFSTPFALAALGLIVSERAGVLSLGAEGYMLAGALGGAGATLALGADPVLALAVAALSGAALSLVYAFLAVTLRVNQVIGGLSIVFLAQGATGLISTKNGWTNQPLTGALPHPLQALDAAPIAGPILFNQDLVVYLTIVLAVGVQLLLTRSLIGLRLRAVGDGPEAADAAGVSIPLYRYGAILAGAALVGLAGGYLSVGVAKIWVDGMAGGRGWIAIALVIFARWRPWRAFAGALLFGGLEALIPRIAAAGVQVPQYFILMTPYLATLAIMTWTSWRGGVRFDEPLALGQPHVREERS